MTKTSILALGLIGAAMSAGCAHTGTDRARPEPAITFRGAKFDLTVSLPEDWRGYSVLAERWESSKYDPKSDRDMVTARGPILVLRDPRWKSSTPRQDIPILVFTRAQWQAGDDEGIYAGGVIYEIAHNARYVFARYSRFSADDSVPGAGEAERILDENAAVNPHLPERQ
jgi:hypothetical protein